MGVEVQWKQFQPTICTTNSSCWSSTTQTKGVITTNNQLLTHASLHHYEIDGNTSTPPLSEILGVFKLLHTHYRRFEIQFFTKICAINLLVNGNVKKMGRFCTWKCLVTWQVMCTKKMWTICLWEENCFLLECKLLTQRSQSVWVDFFSKY
jgi:hypothetical protein